MLTITLIIYKPLSFPLYLLLSPVPGNYHFTSNLFAINCYIIWMSEVASPDFMTFMLLRNQRFWYLLTEYWIILHYFSYIFYLARFLVIKNKFRVFYMICLSVDMKTLKAVFILIQIKQKNPLIQIYWEPPMASLYFYVSFFINYRVFFLW